MRILGRFRSVLGVLVLAVAAFGFVNVAPARAEEVPKQRIQASPALLDFGEMKSGGTYEKVLKIQNTGSENLKYELIVSPYNVDVKDDKYVSDYTKETQYNYITKWITLSQDGGEVEPGKQDEITVTVKVPKDVPAGGQYAVVQARMVNDGNSSDGNSILALSQVGVVVYSSIDGNTRSEGKVIENKVPSFMFNPPVSATSIVENTGNVHFEAKYILQVYPMFGDEEVYTNEENPDVAIVMPETRRLNVVNWEGAPHLGIFRVKQTIKFLDKSEVTEKVVFICPIWFLLIVLAVIFLAIFGIVMHVRGRKD